MSTKSKKQSKKTNLIGLDLSDDPLLKIVKEMDSVDVKDKKAEKNKYSADDNKGRRYFYNFWRKITGKNN